MEVVGWCLLAVALVMIYRYLTRNFDYWAKQNVPFLKPHLIVGSTNFKEPLHLSEKKLYDKYGRIYGRFDGTMPVLTVADTDLLKHILVKDFHVFPNHRSIKSNDSIADSMLFTLEGGDWKRVRNTVSPIFTSAKLRKMIPLLEECTDMVMEKFEKLSATNQEIICQKYFSKFTMGAIGRCTFGISVSDEDEDKLAEKAKDILSCAFSWRTIVVLLFPTLMKLFRITVLNSETLVYFHGFMQSVMNHTKSQDKNGRSDFLQRLIDAEGRYRDSNNNGAIPDDKTGKPPTPTAGLTHDEGIAQCITFFLGGFDATTSLMAFAVHQLAINREYQDRLYMEVEEAIAEQKNILNYDAVCSMRFLDAMMGETLRLCPSLARIERRAEEDYVLGETGILIKKGMLISIPIYAMHRDPERFEDPEKFDPERFMSPDSAPSPYTYLPFGAGPRICLGKRFVEISAKMMLAKLVHRFHIELANPGDVQLKINETRGVLKADEVRVKLTPRAKP